MQHKKTLIVTLMFAFHISTVAAEVLHLPQAIQKALHYRIEVKNAKLASESAALGKSITESQLGWQANASAGYKHGLDTFGQSTDQQRISAGLIKQQRSGDKISLLGSYQNDKSDSVNTSVFPNPIESYGVNIDYTMPLQQGRNNLEYALVDRQSLAGIVISAAQQQAIAEQIGEQIISIYHRLIDIQIQINENQRALKRTEKLNVYIKGNSRLGLAEEKDRLSVLARLAAQQADAKRLQREWTSQLTELQKMTGEPGSYKRVTNYNKANVLPATLEEVVLNVTQRDATIISNAERLDVAKTQIQLSRDNQKDRLDLIFSVGNETRQGERSTTTLDENEWTGGVRLEYTLPLDKRGVDAKTRQSWLEVDQIQYENERYTLDLKNQLQQWYQEWDMAGDTIHHYLNRKRIEQKRHKEVTARYREGRTDIRELLDADEALTVAEKLLAKEEARRSLMLALLSNRLGLFVEASEKK